MLSCRQPALLVALLTASVGAADPALPPTTRPVKPGLMAEFKFDEVGLADVIRAWQDRTGLNVNVDWKALETAAVTRETPVTLRLHIVTARTALGKLLDAAAPKKLTYYVDQNVVELTTVASADERPVTRVFRVSDLIVDAPAFVAPQMGLGNSSGGNGNGNGGTFGGGATGARPAVAKPSDRVASLIATVQATIRPEIWDVNGGTSTIKYLNGNLVVTAPLSVVRLLGH